MVEPHLDHVSPEAVGATLCVSFRGFEDGKRALALSDNFLPKEQKDRMKKLTCEQWILFWVAATLCTLACALCVASDGAQIAVLDYADQWTKTAAVGTLLDAAKASYTDLTPMLERRQLDLANYDILIIGSFITNSRELRENLNAQAKELRDFVERGGVIVEFTQADQDERSVQWLPRGVSITRGDTDYEAVDILRPDHVLFTTPNPISKDDLSGWNILGWPTVWESFTEVEGCAILGARDPEGHLPAILECGWGSGRVLLFAMAPDKAIGLGNEAARQVVVRMIQNILAYGQAAHARQLPPIEVSEAVAPTCYQFAIRGTVFEDTNGDGALNANERGIPGVGVSDGYEVVVSDTDGNYLLPNLSKQAKYVFISEPAQYAKTARFWHLLIGEAAARDFNLPVRRTAAGESTTFHFAQITDIHISGPEDVENFVEGLREINALSKPPLFIVATGDLVNRGSLLYQFHAYQEGIESSDIPVYNVFGNHDRSDDDDRALAYNKLLGPDYYSFDVSSYHFVILNPVIKTERQDHWLADDLAKLGKGKTIVAFEHYAPNLERLHWMESLGIEYVFTGHWHTSKIFTLGTIESFNTPPFVMGGIDNSPSGFLLVNINGDDVTAEYRVNGQSRRLTIVYPGDDLRIAARSFRGILVNAYDTSSDVRKVVWAIGRGEEAIVSGEMRRVGGLRSERIGEMTWRADLDPSLFEPGTYVIQIRAENEAGEHWEATKAISLVRRGPGKKKIKNEWPVFMRDYAHHGTSPTSLSPPFSLAWAHSTGGTIDFSSPIVGDGKVFIGVRDRHGSPATDARMFPREPYGPQRNGIVAVNGLTGERLWFFQTACAIAHTVAYYDGRVYAVDIGGRVYALDANTGQLIWYHDLGEYPERWIFSAPTVKEGILYVGSSAHFAALNAATGDSVWTNTDGYDWISSYASPALGRGKVLMGAVWLEFDNKYGSLYAMSGKNGVREWSKEVLGMHGSPTVTDDRAYYTDTKGNFAAIALDDGHTLWEHQMESAWSPVTPAISGRWIVVGSGTGTVYCFDAKSHKILWQFESGKSVYRMSPYQKDFSALLSSPTIAGHVVYIGSSDGHLYALDIKTGERLWAHDFGVPVLSTPAISGNMLFVGTYDGQVYAFQGKRPSWWKRLFGVK
jgi:outer membrane protein assembly factor BamB/predicted phosphodiesterase